MKKKLVSMFSALMLMLMLTTTALAAPTAEKEHLRFQGTLHALEIGVFDPLTGNVSVTANGSGKGTLLGRFTYSYAVVISPTSTGTLYYTFVAANGDSLYSIGQGMGAATELPNIFRVTETHTITGGTGRFAGATGSFNIDRLILQPDGTTWGTFTGNVVLAEDK
jgi:hypothetical protein